MGELPDAAQYGDLGSNTLGNLAEAVGGLLLPNLERLGLGKIRPIRGLSGSVAAQASYGYMAEQSPGKDSIYGHWELMGLIARQPQPTYPGGFPQRIVDQLETASGRHFIGNIAASGTEIIQRLGSEHIRTGKLILYTSADSVLQIASHEEIIPVVKLYQICQIARGIMTGQDAVGRIIARPFIGPEGSFIRTSNRKDFSLPPPNRTILDHLCLAGKEVLGIGKIEDLFAGQGITEAIHTKSNRQGLEETLEAIKSKRRGFIFTNLVDFDMMWGHRNDVAGYYSGLREVDLFLPEILANLSEDDVLVLTADHGCDPTTPSTDHSREYVPILIYGKKLRSNTNLGCRDTFADLAATIADYFGVTGTGSGKSFWKLIQPQNN